MDCNVVECERAERDGGGAACVRCGCGGGSLDVLGEVQRAYEARLQLIVDTGGPNVLQRQVRLLQGWVSDLAGQNALLVRAVQQLEDELAARLLLERRRHAERDVSNESCDRVTELKALIESLQKEIETKDREIRRLKQSTEQYEQVIMSLKKEMSLSNYQTPDVSKLDVGVTADICCPGLQVREVEPVKDYTSLLRKETAEYHGRLEQLDEKVKSSSEHVRALREANVSLTRDVHTLQQLCAALAEQGRLAELRAQFSDHLVREMRRQFIQAKAKLRAQEESCIRVSKDIASSQEIGRACTTCNSSMSGGEPCVRQQPRRSLRRRPPPPAPERWPGRGTAATDDEVSSRLE